ncbi:MAG: TonB-dependent receptor, partial [Gammaproteobacteria bacterium]
MNQVRKTAIALGVAQFAMACSGAAMAQDAADKPNSAASVVVVTGQRAALQSAAKIKQNADEIVDSIVADDIGKLPDRSVTEVLQRIVGVSIDRTMSKGDPEHYSVEGSGVTIRGLTYVRSELNGRDSFSANGGRSLNFEDVPPELMAGVDVYKNPSAEQIEGSIGGLVNLRTAMPFDFKGFKFGASAETTYSTLKKGKTSPGGSVMLSDRWKTGIGEIGLLVDIASSKSVVRTDAFQVEPYYPHLLDGKLVYIPKGAQWRTLMFDRKRDGQYAALQWKLNNELRSSFTYFKSKYKMQWDENAIFAQSEPYRIVPSADSTYGPNGNLLTGTLTSPLSNGINFGGDTRTADRNSSTTDMAWNVEWRPSPSWTVTADVQKVKARTRSFDSTVATGITMQKETLDLTGDRPNLIFDADQRAYLADPKNYYWAFTMEHGDESVANEKAARADVKYSFDHPVLRDLRFGVRFTDRDALNTNTNPGYNWQSVSQPWEVGWRISRLASLSDPKFAGNTHLHEFKNFFGGGVSVPSLVFPDVSVATGYPGSYEALHKYHDILCAEQEAKQGWTDCTPWKAATFGTDPFGVNDQREKSKAFYTQLRFGWDNLTYPIDGNIGVRYVHTNMSASGYTLFTPRVEAPPEGFQRAGVPIPNIPAYAQARDYENSYSNFLPSLNLRMKVSPELQLRLGVSSGLSRPDFKQLQGYTSLEQSISGVRDDATKTVYVTNVNLNGNAEGNPYLKPTTSRQIDLTAEYYFSAGSSFTVAVFNKKLRDIVINQLSTYQLPDVNGKLYDFVVTSPVNGAKGTARGVELAFQHYFDKLPGWMSGIGMQFNYTYVDSHRKLYN